MRHELWYAFRRLRARPWHTAAVIVIFAVGSGAALTVFRLADAILLRSLPYASANRLVRVTMHVPIAPATELPFSDVGYRALEHRSRSFDVLASYRLVGVNLTVGKAPRRVLSARVTANFFDVLGLPAQRGRLFAPGAEEAKGPAVMVLSDALWREAFGADFGVIGSTVRVDGAPATIIGVADPRIAFPAAEVGYFTLMDLDPVGTSPFQLGIDVVGRLRTGATLQSAVADCSRVLREVARENPGPHRTASSDVSEFRAIVRPIRDDMAGGAKPTLALLIATVLFVLLLTCVNVATLELVRSSGRRAELAVRSALGAERGRLILGALVEGCVQATLGGLAGLALSGLTVGVLQGLLPVAFGAAESARLSVGIMCAAAATIIICATASGIFPIMATIGHDLQSSLRGRDPGTRRLTWLRRGLIVTQIAFACVLVFGAALMIVTVRDAQRVTLGFQPDGLVVFNLSLPRETYPARGDVSTAFNTLVDRLRSVPGVTHVALASRVPLDPDAETAMIGVEGRPFKADGTDPNVDFRIVSAGYFDAMGIRVVAGRAFAEGDSYLDGTPVVISKTMGALLWPDGGDPIGHRIRTGPFAPWLPIVGVVSDAKNRSLTRPSRAEMYLPFGAPRSPMGVSREMTFVVRAGGSVASVQAAVQRVVLQGNPDLPLYGSRRYSDVVEQSQVREVTTSRTLAAFAVVALALAVTGCYALLMFAVVQRRRELALRRAVGATSDDLIMLIGREMGELLLVGIGAGVAGAVALSHLLSAFLTAVSPLDPRVTGVTIAIVAVAGLAAAMLPARRAGDVDLMIVLRTE
jgi:putative ABC transport system permease protein